MGTSWVVAAAAVAMAAVGLASCSSDTAEGDAEVVFQGADVRVYSGTLAEAGQEVVFGPAVLENTGSSSATLLDARLVGDVPSSSAEVIDLRVKRLTEADGDMVGAAIWPFEDFEKDSVELEGFQIEPGDEVEVLYVVRVNRTGVWDWPEVALTYKSGEKRHETTALTGFRICPPDEDDCASQDPAEN